MSEMHEATAVSQPIPHFERFLDSREAAELLQVFLMGRGYGVSPQAAMDAVGRVEMAGCSLPVLQQELENLALVM